MKKLHRTVKKLLMLCLAMAMSLPIFVMPALASTTGEGVQGDSLANDSGDYRIPDEIGAIDTYDGPDVLGESDWPEKSGGDENFAEEAEIDVIFSFDGSLYISPSKYSEEEKQQLFLEGVAITDETGEPVTAAWIQDFGGFDITSEPNTEFIITYAARHKNGKTFTATRKAYVTENPDFRSEDTSVVSGVTAVAISPINNQIDLRNAIIQAEPGDTIYLDSDIELTSALEITKRITLASRDGESYSLIAKNQNHTIETKVGGDLMLQNIVVTHTGQGGGSFINCGIYIHENSVVTLGEGAKIYGTKCGVRVYGQFNMSDGIISDCTGDGGVLIDDIGEFNMNGGEIKKNVYGVNARHGSMFNMSGGTITENNYGVVVGGLSSPGVSCTVNMEGGEISGSKNYGVYLGWGTFNMFGGAISRNAVSGVHINNVDAAFIMHDGTISDNSTNKSGGGVFVQTGMLKMSGGEISGNTARVNGGGVYLQAGTFHMEGGEISGNTANGNGGGIHTLYYINLTTSSTSIFRNNMAGSYTADYGIERRGEAGEFPNILWDENYPLSLIGTHVLNNYDINFGGNLITFKMNDDTNNTYATRYAIGTGYNDRKVGEDKMPPDPTRAGYLFAGWFTESTGGSQFTGSTLCQGPMTVYAHWNPKIYSITYENIQPGDINNNPDTYTIKSNAIFLSSASRGGFKFEGWYSNAALTEKLSGIAINTGSIGNKIFYAKWTQNIYVVRFENWDGSLLKSEQVPHGGSATAPINPHRSGYTFIGWDRSYTGIIADITVTALYEWDSSSGGTPEPNPGDRETSDPGSGSGSGGGGATVPEPLALPSQENILVTESRSMPEDVNKWSDDGNIPLITIGNREIQLFAPFGAAAWALLNLILCVLGVIVAIITIFRALLHKKRERNEEVNGYNIRGEKQKMQHRPAWLVTVSILGIAGVFVFLLTENMHELMVMLDLWTIANAALLVAEIITAVLVFRRSKEIVIFETKQGKH